LIKPLILNQTRIKLLVMLPEMFIVANAIEGERKRREFKTKVK
jgi:hypothetical protein